MQLVLTKNSATKAAQITAFTLGQIAQPRYGQLPQDVIIGTSSAKVKILLYLDLFEQISGFIFRAFTDVFDRVGGRMALVLRFATPRRPTLRTVPRCFAEEDDSETTVYVDRSLTPKHLLVLAAQGEQKRVRHALDDWFSSFETRPDAVRQWLKRHPVNPQLVILAANALRAHSRWAHAHDILTTPAILVNKRRLL